jgi:molecular chaperone DnaJ
VLKLTHYDILGIGRAADDAEIKKAYRRMLIAFHPDTYRGDKQFAADKNAEIIERIRCFATRPRGNRTTSL